MTTTVNRAPVTVAELVAAIDEQRRGIATKAPPSSGSVVLASAEPRPRQPCWCWGHTRARE